MSKYVVVVFPEESKAYDGEKAFTILHYEGNLSVYGIAILKKDAEGNVHVRKADDEGPIGTAVGMLTGAMIGLLAGPAGASVGAAGGAAMGAAGGALMGSMADLNNAGVGLDFIDMVGNKMDADTAAVIAEIDEYWTIPLDNKMEELGGTVYRQNRNIFEDEQWEQEVQAWKQDMADFKAEVKESNDENKAKLKAKSDALKQRLHDANDKNKAKIQQLEEETKAKVAKLEEQAAKSKDEAKAKIEKRKEEIKAKHDARTARLKEAGEHIKEALLTEI